MDKLFSTKDAATYLGKTVRTIQNWKAKGKIVPAKTDESGADFYTEEQLRNIPTKDPTKDPTKTPYETSLMQPKNPTKNRQISYEPTKPTKDLTKTPYDTPDTATDEKRCKQSERNFEFEQHLENLPVEILKQPRFFRVKRDKAPYDEGWNVPANQKLYFDIPQDELAGFDTVGHGKATDYLFLDFDHVLDDAGNFVNQDAEKWYNYIATTDTFCERSISGHGLHFLLKPTPNLFPSISAGTKGTLHFGDKHTKDSPKLEIFYGSKGRYCLLTGDMFRCEPTTPIADAEAADEVFYHLINEIKKNLPPEPAKKSKPAAQIHSDNPDYDAFRAGLMLDCIVPADLPDTDWLAVQSAAKNIGIPYTVVDAWNQQDPDRYNEKQNQIRWDSLDDPSFDISTLHGIAKRFNYSEKDARQQWYQLHPDLKPSHSRKVAPDLSQELDDAIILLDSLTPDNFTRDDAYNRDNIRAVAIAQHFGFITQAEKFFTTIKKAKDIARNRIKESNDELTAPMDDHEKETLNNIIRINLDTIKTAVKSEVSNIANHQKAFLQNQQLKQQQEQARINAEIHQQKINEYLCQLVQLQKQYRTHPTPEIASQMRQLICDSCEWKFNKSGKPVAVKATAANLDLIFNNDPTIDGLIGFDEFQQADVFLKQAEWRKDKCFHEEVKDSDVAQIRNYLRRTYSELANKNLVDDWLIEFSNKYSFHEVKEFFQNLPKWDGTPRAETLFIKFLRADDTPYTREVTLNLLTAAVARIFHPGCNYQLAPILVGEQGIGKSYVISRLGGKWYGSLIDDVGDPHAVDAIQKLWIVEIKEMAAMKKDIDANKRFIDAAEDVRRAAYERRAAKFKRHCVFLITTNNNQCLIDMTGNRRHPVIKCNSSSRNYVEGLTNDFIQQLWSEVYAHYQDLFKDGFDPKLLELSKAAQIQSDEIAEQYLRDDGMTGEIKAFLDTKITPLVIWDLLSREERRKFFVNGGGLIMVDALTEFNHRRRARGGKPDDVQRDVNLIYDFLNGTAGKNFVRIEKIKRGDNVIDEYHIYGSELRQHICAAEIFTECFGSDKRKSMHRISEILSMLDDWALGKRIQKDSAYGDQKKVYYRNKDEN